MAKIGDELRGSRGRSQAARLCLILIALAACRNGAIEPVDIAAEDMCAQCKMAISEKRFAAEFIDRDGQPFKFDDIACMAGYIKQRGGREKISVYFVSDFDSRQWVKAEAAYYVRSPEIKTPMSGGVVAFKDEAESREAVATYRGEPLSFNDLFGPEE
jgi:copper chaperone NosL